MEIKCPNCGQACEAAEEPAIGQHLLCPFCDMKFNYTPQNTTENDSYTAANTAETNVDAPSAKIQTTCPHCGAVYEVDAAYISETATCGTCNKAFVVKVAQETQSPDASADAAVEKAAENTSAATNGHIAATLGKKKRIKTIRTKAKAPANAAKDKLVALRQRGGNSKLKLVISGIAALLTANLVVAVLFYFNKGAGDELKNLNSDGDGIVQDTRKAIETSSQASQIHSTGKITTESSRATNDAGDGFRDMNSDGDGVAKDTRQAIATPRQTNQIHSTGAITTESSTDSCKATIVLPPGAPGELLLKYAELGETDYVRAVLAQNSTLDVNRPKAAGNKTALYLACEKGFSDIVELLLKKNADAKIYDAIPGSFRAVHKYSPLTIAAKNGHHAILKMLLASRKVDIESRDGSNRTALYAAAANNQPEAVKFLCQSRAKVNIEGLNKWTPLTVAAGQGYADVVKVLLQYGDNPDLEMPGGWPTGSPLLHAVKNNHPKVVEILCKAKAKVNIHCPPNNRTLLMESVDEGHTEVVKALLKYGDGLDLEMRGGRLSETALHCAVSQNNPEIVELLCKAGANVHAETGTYLGNLTTPLGRARYKGYSEVVKILVRYK